MLEWLIRGELLWMVEVAHRYRNGLRITKKQRCSALGAETTWRFLAHAAMTVSDILVRSLADLVSHSPTETTASDLLAISHYDNLSSLEQHDSRAIIHLC